MEKEQLIALIDKYLAGNCSREEERIVEMWYNSVQHEQGGFQMGDEIEIAFSAERSLAAIGSKLGFKAGPAETNRARFQWQWMAAACVALILSIAATLLIIRKPQETFAVIRARTGEVKTVQLPDGTQVWLNAGSTLKYSSLYNQQTRKVWLSGEAYFDVVHDTRKPFDVIGGKLRTHVLGTAFAVSVYPDAKISTVTVLRGKVQVSDRKKVLGYLLPNKELEYNDTDEDGRMIDVNAERITSWKSGRLAFVEMPMKDIAIHLQKWYGVKFIFSNQSLENRRLTASFRNTISLKDLLDVLSDVNHVHYKIDSNSNTVIYR